MSEDSKQPAKREHKVGQGTGYETDGVNYWVAPAQIDSWCLIQDQERALDSIIEAMTRTVAQARVHVEAQRRKWWDAVYRDLDLDKSRSYVFNRMDGKVSPVEKAEKG